MKSISINKLNEHFDEEVVISGFVDNIRNLQWVQFVIIRDDTSKVQVTIEKSEEKNKEMVELIENLPLESTVKITGKVVESPKVKLNGMEIIPESIEVTSKSEEEIPFNFKDLNNVNLDTRLDYRFIDLRNDKNMLIFKIQSDITKYMRQFLYEKDFTEIHTPKLIGAASESGSEVFEVKYFDDKAYLAQSPQFYKQMAMASGFNKIFEVAPVFRAENSNTSRHATEFTSFDVEMSYIDSFEDVMDLEAELIAYTFDKISKKYKEKIKEVFDMDIVVPKLPFPRLSLSDIYKELEERYNYKVDDSEKTDLTTEAERLCYKLSKDKFNHEFLFVTDYPADKRAFYHMRDKNGLLLGYDLIWRGVEITSGAQREHRYEEIEKNATEKGLKDDVKFYLEFFKYGCPPHGGFGIGLDRLTMLLLGIPSVKESQFLFRGPNRLNP
ncbi:MAG: aspartate--tRNA(Asn) ligase [Bacilli bacterium]|nr:aspartate--tRNA(Asn) ligase [Bacilli bacterium]MBR3049505.1 aspartate--tRNA(Asn) ligase [Bacilli bacterium]